MTRSLNSSGREEAQVFSDEDDVFSQGSSLRQLLAHREDAVYVPQQAKSETFNMRMWALSSRGAPGMGATAIISGGNAATAVVANDKARKKKQRWAADEELSTVVDQPFFDYTFSHSSILEHREPCELRPTTLTGLSTIHSYKPGADMNRSVLEGVSALSTQHAASNFALTEETVLLDKMMRRDPPGVAALPGKLLGNMNSSSSVATRAGALQPTKQSRLPEAVPLSYGRGLDEVLKVTVGERRRCEERRNVCLSSMSTWASVSADVSPSALPWDDEGSCEAPIAEGIPSVGIEPGFASGNNETAEGQRCHPATVPAVLPAPVSSMINMTQALEHRQSSRLRRYYGTLASTSATLIGPYCSGIGSASPFAAEVALQKQLTSHAALPSTTPSRRSVTPATQHSSRPLTTQQHAAGAEGITSSAVYDGGLAAFQHLAVSGEPQPGVGSFAPAPSRAAGAPLRFQRHTDRPVSPAETQLPLFHPVPYNELYEEQRILFEQRDIHKKAYEETKRLYKNQTAYIETAVTAMADGQHKADYPVSSSALKDIPELELSRMRLQRDDVPVMFVRHEHL